MQLHATIIQQPSTATLNNQVYANMKYAHVHLYARHAKILATSATLDTPHSYPICKQFEPNEPYQIKTNQ